jgi:hypothetical protein
MKKQIPTSVYTLLGVNTLPLLGVLFWGWSLVDILFLYWAETAVIGFYSILKVLLLRDNERGWIIILVKFMRILGSVLFVIHLGGFIAGEGIVLYFVGREFLGLKQSPLELLHVTRYVLASLFLSHGYSFVSNFLIKSKRNVEKGKDPMFEPYRRVVIIHLALSFGMGFVIFYGQSLALLVILIVLKTVVDLWTHLRERKRYS